MILRFAFALPLILHGLAHISGFLASWTAADVGYSDHAWIFTSNIHIRSPVGKASGLLWLVAAMGLVGSGLGILSGEAWWAELGLAGAAISLVVIISWWNTVPPGAKAGAAFDVIILLGLSTPIQAQIQRLIS